MFAESDRFILNEGDRLIHDDVLQTLILIAAPRAVIPAPLARAAAQKLAEILGIESATPGGLLEQLALRAAAPHLGQLQIAVSGSGPVLPPRVQLAILGAASEALTNAAKHACATRVAVDVAVEGDQTLTVTITDDGIGFDQAAILQGRRGIKHSILERMREVGARGEVHANPAGGTQVRLSWGPVSAGGGVDLPAVAAPLLLRAALDARIPDGAAQVRQFTSAIAGGDLDLADPAVQHHAACLEYSLRSGIGMASSDPLADEFARLRSRGIDVALRHSSELTEPVAERLLQLLRGIDFTSVTSVRATILDSVDATHVVVVTKRGTTQLETGHGPTEESPLKEEFGELIEEFIPLGRTATVRNE